MIALAFLPISLFWLPPAPTLHLYFQFSFQRITPTFLCFKRWFFYLDIIVLGHIVQKKNSVSSFEVGPGKRFVSLLSGSVENVQLDGEFVNLTFFDSEVDATCASCFGIEFVIDILLDKAGLSDTLNILMVTWVSKQDNLETQRNLCKIPTHYKSNLCWDQLTPTRYVILIKIIHLSRLTQLNLSSARPSWIANNWDLILKAIFPKLSSLSYGML